MYRPNNRNLAVSSSSCRTFASSVRSAGSPSEGIELALRFLIERRLAIGEIAFLLGFSEAGAFHRAFRHWTGQAPHAFRALQYSPNDSLSRC
jgi:hypothetical protein